MGSNSDSRVGSFDSLAGQGFDEAAFRELVERLRRGEFDEAPLPSTGEPPGPGDVIPLPERGLERYAECAALGEEALRKGEVASAVVAGGAGTRFGGAVKALVPVLEDRTFLDFKLLDAQRIEAVYRRRPPLALMTSPLTHAAIQERIDPARLGRDVFLFQQRMLPRLTADGSPLRESNGRISLSPAGHGDFYRALRESGVGQALWQRGVRWLCFSNIDNLPAVLDPIVVGLHRALGKAMTVELTARARPDGQLDSGGAPMRIDGVLQLVEKVDPSLHPLISTNNITFDLDCILKREIPLPFRIVRKQVSGRPAFQFEQVTAEATGLLGAGGRPLLPTAFIQVPREGIGSRFHPAKTPEDLPIVVRWLEEHLRAAESNRSSGGV